MVVHLATAMVSQYSLDMVSLLNSERCPHLLPVLHGRCWQTSSVTVSPKLLQQLQFPSGHFCSSPSMLTCIYAGLHEVLSQTRSGLDHRLLCIHIQRVDTQTKSPRRPRHIKNAPTLNCRDLSAPRFRATSPHTTHLLSTHIKHNHLWRHVQHGKGAAARMSFNYFSFWSWFHSVASFYGALVVTIAFSHAGMQNWAHRRTTLLSSGPGSLAYGSCC